MPYSDKPTHLLPQRPGQLSESCFLMMALNIILCLHSTTSVPGTTRIPHTLIETTHDQVSGWLWTSPLACFSVEWGRAMAITHCLPPPLSRDIRLQENKLFFYLSNGVGEGDEASCMHMSRIWAAYETQVSFLLWRVFFFFFPYHQWLKLVLSLRKAVNVATC